MMRSKLGHLLAAAAVRSQGFTEAGGHAPRERGFGRWLAAATLIASMGGTLATRGLDVADAEVRFRLVVIDAEGPEDLWLKTYGDLSGNGRPDLIVGGNRSGGLVWYENPTWRKHVIDAEHRFGTDAEVADVNGNGLLDVVAIRYDLKLVWYENPTWTPHVIAEDMRLHDVEVADFDGDGQVEIVGRNQGEFGQSGARLFLFKQVSPSSWVSGSFPVPEGEGLAAADVNGNGRLDLVVNETWYENTGTFLGDGAWIEHVYTDTWTHRNAFVAVGDVNGDGRPDVVLAPAELAGQRYRISWFEAPADPTDGPWIEHVIDPDAEAVHHFVGVADFNGSDRLDVAAAEMEQGQDPDEVKIYLNGGDGTSWTKHVIFAGGSHSMRILDVDGDGRPDIFGANWQGREVLLWVNETP